MKFGKVMQLSRPELYISPRHDAWLRGNPNATYSLEAKHFLLEEAGKAQRKREGTVSASSFGSCVRQQQFKFIGLPQRELEAKTISIFHNGTWTHLRWQLAGLTAGWLVAAEVPIPKNEMGLSGTADGLCADDSVLEVKSINSAGFADVLAWGAKRAHIAQLTGYLIALGKTKGRFIYENKDTQEYKEIVLELTEQMREEFYDHIENIWNVITDEELVEPLDPCIDHKQPWGMCPFRDVCLDIKDWKQAEEMK